MTVAYEEGEAQDQPRNARDQAPDQASLWDQDGER